ncbi:MAG: hypothetical protein Q8S73_45100 [Deltaproteobacteria bacterium]|nr:hypothetical protein [Myxococcales bacterium]MDP3221346.1 hypothetical protein [Deltaproteobacteria bacterium]
MSISAQEVTGLGWEGVPLPDAYQLAVTIVLSNTGAAMPLTTTIDRFSLVTDMARVLQPSGISRDCLSGERLAVGGRATCQLTFSVARNQRPARVTYDSGAGATASVAVPVVDLAPLPLTLEGACQARETVRQNETSRQCADCASVYCEAEQTGYGNALRAAPPTSCSLLGCVYDSQVPVAERCACVQACFAPTVWQAYGALTNCYIRRCWDACAQVSNVRDAGR